jgi:hypothetical protein
MATGGGAGARRGRGRGTPLDAAVMAAPPAEECPSCAALRARAERAEAQLAEARAQLDAIQKRRASRKRRKSPAAPSPDWLLVEEVRGMLGVTVGELAARCGLTTPTVFSKAQDIPLSPALRGKLEALKHAHAGTEES